MLALPCAMAHDSDAALEWLRTWSNTKDAKVVKKTAAGQSDVRRTFYSSGKIRTLTTSSKKSGAPDLRFTYSEAGDVIKKEYDVAGHGRIDTIVTYENDRGTKTEVTRYLDDHGRTKKTLRIWKTEQGYYKQRTQLADGRSYDEIIPEDAWDHDDSHPETDCDPRNAPPLSPAQFEAVVKKLEDRIEVNGNCEGFKLYKSAPTTFTAESIKARMASAISKGLRCLRGKGPNGERLSDEILADLFTSADKKLKLNCNAKDAIKQCGESAEPSFCARSTHFDDPSSPQIYLNNNCPMPEENLDSMLFHESMHLTGGAGHQNLHHYDSVEETEFVEPCAQCCHGNSELKDKFCELCSDHPSKDPVAHNLKYGILALKSDYSEVAWRELEKAAAVDPNNIEVQRALLETYIHLRDKATNAGKKPAPGLIMRLLVAANKFKSLVEHPETRSKRAPTWPGYAGSSSDPMLVKLSAMYLTDDYFNADPPIGVKGIDGPAKGHYTNVRYFQTQLQALMKVCTHMSAGTGDAADDAEKHARTCHSRAGELTDKMSENLELFAKDTSSNKDKVLNPSDVDDMRDYIKRARKGIDCVTAGTPLLECKAAYSADDQKAAADAAPADNKGAPACKPPKTPL